MAIHKISVIQPKFPFVGVEILSTFWFLCIILGPDMLDRQSRALKTQMIF